MCELVSFGCATRINWLQILTKAGGISEDPQVVADLPTDL
jgi:hypothetical protein